MRIRQGAGAPMGWLAVAGAVVALAGCGADELSEEEYNTRLDTVFDEVNTELPKASSDLTPESSLEDRAAALAEGEPVIAQAVTDLEDIEPPPEFADLHERLIALLEEFGEATREAREAAERGDPEGLSDYQLQTARFQEELALLAQGYGEAGLGVGSTTRTGTSSRGGGSPDGGGETAP